MHTSLIRAIIQMALPSILAIAVTSGMQIARIESLEKELLRIQTEIDSHETDERVDDIIEKLEQQLMDVIRSLNRIEQRISLR